METPAKMSTSQPWTRERAATHSPKEGFAVVGQHRSPCKSERRMEKTEKGRKRRERGSEGRKKEGGLGEMGKKQKKEGKGGREREILCFWLARKASRAW